MRRSALFVVVVVIATTTAAWGQSTDTDEEAAIKRHLDGYAEARRIGDGDAQARFYSEDADEICCGSSQIFKGRAAIAQRLKLPPDPNRKFKLQVAALRFVSADVALVDALFYNQSPPESNPGHAFYIMVRRNGQWFIRAARIGFRDIPPPQR